MSIESDCASAADLMSCAAMMSLAKQEAVGNIHQLSYLVNNPSCERFHTLADRTTENKLKMDPATLSRKLCVTKTPVYGEGQWVQMMHPPLTRVQENFDEWTRSK